MRTHLYNLINFILLNLCLTYHTSSSNDKYKFYVCNSQQFQIVKNGWLLYLLMKYNQQIYELYQIVTYNYFSS